MNAAAEVTRFRALLAARLGWTFDDNDTAQLADVLGRRADTHGLSRPRYLGRLATAEWESELTTLAEVLSVNETYFYRHSEQFAALAEVALPERIRARSGQRVLRMLSVGCSSGEEAYTLAIMAREVQPDEGWITSVQGLDANPDMLRRATRARYSAWSLRQTPDTIRRRYFHPCEGDFELDAAIRSAVRFRHYNVANDDEELWLPDKYDVVFCRNLLMYLTPEVRESLVRRMTRALAPGGYLFLGHTDSLGSRPEGLQPQHTHHTFYYRRQQPMTSPTSAAPPVTLPSPDPGPLPATPTASDVHERAMRLLLEERFTEALRLIEAVPADRPAPRDLLLHGVLLAHAGRLDDAEMLCRRLLDIDGLSADAHHQLAVCLEGGAAVDVAIGHYRLAAYLDPDFAMPRLRLGLLTRRRGENRVAGPELDRALTLLRQERDERIALFGGGFGKIALTTLCRAELDACGAYR
ncbi:protein-glutamate O-methyltransferase [Actinoplanes sp. ATCC 53533]|uniref:CheR family methyltransferase n=1 Tax=Actinoplanes sp. ATCC 53533 TaxID=1288362 RepID=UPI000F78F9F8|nr:protein-glutamate O-methyltransferase CheR [Actinoplanes sp. ATCC 53533]RSM55735.1 protein-glutamate O-methyltransferase [Actinoplanes sp. ATCC 53533]